MLIDLVCGQGSFGVSTKSQVIFSLRNHGLALESVRVLGMVLSYSVGGWVGV